MKNESGLSLISVLWIITILSVIASQFIYSVSLEQRMKKNLVDRTKYYYAAKAGLERVIAETLQDETGYDSLDEDWASEITGKIQDGTSSKTLAYSINITDEASKVNINTADQDMFMGLLGMAGLDEENSQMLAQAIVQKRDESEFRTVLELANVEGMTEELLYGTQTQTTTGGEATTENTMSTTGTEDEESMLGLMDLVTIYSVDKNVDAEGNQRVNINSAEQQQISQITDENGQQVFSNEEAQMVIDQRDESEYESIEGLLDTPAVSQNLFDSISDQITVDENEAQNEGRININTADSGQLASLPGMDQGIADDVIRYRNDNGDFSNTDEIRDAKLITTDEFKSIVDKITISDEDTIPGLINVNTASQEILELLPGMDENKAQAIVSYREGTSAQSVDGESEEGNPFANIGQLLDVEGIDEDTFKELTGHVTYRSYAFTVDASGIDPNEKTIAPCKAVIDRSGEQIEIKYWKQS